MKTGKQNSLLYHGNKYHSKSAKQKVKCNKVKKVVWKQFSDERLADH
jgi:hypothetical protein